MRSISTIPVRLLASFLAMLFAAAASADPPSQDEQNAFNAVYGRVQGHNAQQPHGTGDVQTSLTESCWGMSFTCPEGSQVQCVTYWYCTRLVAWTANPQDGEEAAAYVWDSSPTVTQEGSCKVIRYDNEIMIDASVFTPNENGGDLGRTLNEGLLYHELLHGQLGIEYLTSQAAIDNACACNTPDPGAHGDLDHRQIPGWQDTYLQNVANLAGNTVQVFRPAIPASGDGTFRITLGQKNGWSGTVRVPDGGNVQDADISDPNNDGSIVLTGTLIDKTKKGHVIVLVDPSGLFLYWFVHVDAAAAPVPAVSASKAAMLVLLLLAAGMLALRRRAHGATRSRA